MPRLQAVVQVLAGKSEQKSLTPQVERKAIALLLCDLCLLTNLPLCGTHQGREQNLNCESC